MAGLPSRGCVRKWWQYGRSRLRGIGIVVSPPTKALAMRKRSYYVSPQQHTQLRLALAAVIALPVLAIGLLVFMFPQILDLGDDGGQELIERAWERMEAQPVQLALFVTFGLFTLLQSGYMLLARRRERLLVDEVGIRYVSPLPEFLRTFRPSWRLQWSQIRHAKVETSRMSPLFHAIVLDAGLVQRKIVPFQWVVMGDEPIGPMDPGKWRSLDSEAIRSLLQLSPITQHLTQTAVDLNFDSLLSSQSKSFALEQNPSTLLAIVLFFGLAAYALIDSVFLLQESYVERPFYEFYVMMGILLAILVGAWLLRAQVPRTESLTLAALVGVGVAVSLYPGLLRINAASDASGLREHRYVLESNQTFTAVDAELPALHFERYGEYWAQFESGSIHRFELRNGGLGFYQLNTAPIYAAMKEFYRELQAKPERSG